MVQIKRKGKYPDVKGTMDEFLDKLEMGGIKAPQPVQNDLEIYFRKISDLYDAGEEFPVNLDEVYPLVYSTKGNAVRDLKNNFLQDVDYLSLIKNDKQKDGSGGQNEVTYMLSVSCLEYFIARRVPEVFNVYREIFHRVRHRVPQSFSEALMLAAKQQEQIELQSKQLEEQRHNPFLLSYLSCL